MSKKKLYVVEVEVTVQMLVAAEDKTEAEDIALDNFKEDFESGAGDTSAISHEMTKINKQFSGVIPWGVEDVDPRRNWTAEQWLAAND